MGKIKENIVSGLQLNNKWVRSMLIISTIIILVVLFFPQKSFKQTYVPQNIEYILDSIPFLIEIATEQSDSTRQVPIIRERPVPYRIDGVKSLQKASEPFDWKGTITWAIGAMNGLILIVLNIKNLILKKKP